MGCGLERLNHFQNIDNVKLLNKKKKAEAYSLACNGFTNIRIPGIPVITHWDT